MSRPPQLAHHSQQLRHCSWRGSSHRPSLPGHHRSKVQVITAFTNEPVAVGHHSHSRIGTMRLGQHSRCCSRGERTQERTGAALQQMRAIATGHGNHSRAAPALVLPLCRPHRTTPQEEEEEAHLEQSPEWIDQRPERKFGGHAGRDGPESARAHQTAAHETLGAGSALPDRCWRHRVVLAVARR